MLRLFNTHGKKSGNFHPVNDRVVHVFTCGPSVYQRSHIGNFRTFLFEDILIRYLEYLGYHVERGMNVTDVEDKAFEEADKKRMSVKDLTEQNIRQFISEMKILKMKPPDYFAKASEALDEAVEIIEGLLDRKIAYRHDGNIYFDPLKFPGFGQLYGLDMSRWPSEKRRYHRDTYPGMRWNLGDFILWHGAEKAGAVSWETRIGKGRPSWNVQDPSVIFKHYHETLSIYCGGIDNLFRHHDYTRAILESVRPYPMAKYWLHCQHLVVRGQKMSKSKGNIYYTDMIQDRGYSTEELRFFLIYGHYRKKLNYSEGAIQSAAEKLKSFRKKVREIEEFADPLAEADGESVERVKTIFAARMDDDLNVKKAFDELNRFFSKVDVRELKSSEASGLIRALKEIDNVLRVIF
jgi:cysteinyl-tRNA synthetase